MDAVVNFIVILAIGIAVGFLYERYTGPGWLTRQFSGPRRGVLTYCLVGIAGSFIGYNVFVLLRLGNPLTLFVGAAIGAAVILWTWRSIR
jgi:uncharacterized membrane protein YeaQ/YmgE (transglycosylase-associated protein family)